MHAWEKLQVTAFSQGCLIRIQDIFEKRHIGKISMSINKRIKKKIVKSGQHAFSISVSNRTSRMPEAERECQQ